MMEHDIADRLAQIKTAVEQDTPQAAVEAALSLLGGFLINQKRIADALETLANAAPNPKDHE